MPPHILIVDDEAPIRELLEELLARTCGYRVTPATSADEAMRVVESDCPQLVITDLQLEESDGFELADRIKAIAPNLPILLLTGVLFDRQALQATAGHKIAAYVEKTAPLARILSEVQRLLGVTK
ncbi:MAG: response regulator [Verrucomicrobiota bacterium]